ncbi:MAG TPA: 3'-5' exonuclease [Rhodanobacteraceae bacterium]|nr:3'-5' exonuclease [Rhodanobacteraceae bacterium]
MKTTAFDLQMNPANPGMNFHKLDRARDKNFWSVRVNADIRLIVHKTPHSMLLCYVDHHDNAYDWAERRKLETHPTTGAAQLVEIRERVEEIPIPTYVQVEQPRRSPAQAALFPHIPDDELLGYGVPPEWLADVKVANEDSLLELADHLPAEAAEALLELATGGTPKPRIAAATGGAAVENFTLALDHALPSAPVKPFEHPDAQRRFRTILNVEELERALDYPWDKWTIFLHPVQREWVERNYSGPARVSGSAGTGKTIVALHRAVHLARTHPEARVLLATFSDTLANALRSKLRRLISNEPRLGERIDVHAMDDVGKRLYEATFGKLRLATPEEIRALLIAAAEAHPDHKFSQGFLASEWNDVVDGWQLMTWEQYREVQRLGRKTRLPESRRAALWAIYEHVRAELKRRGWTTRAAMFERLTAELPTRRHPPFDFAVIDEAQDISVAQLKFLAALGGDRPDALFFAGDQGQRIFQQPFSWKSLGVDIRGRARTLHINYRTSHQIRSQADRLLAPEVADVDGNVEDRRGTVSVFNGPPPEIYTASSIEDECSAVGAWLRDRIAEGTAAHEVGVFVRSSVELERARTALETAGLPFQILDDSVSTVPNRICVSTMHRAKGLEYRAVAVMACDDEVIPSQARIETVTDDADLEEVYNSERYLLYVACTRARDRLWISGVEPASEFLDDLQSKTSRD